MNEPSWDVGAAGQWALDTSHMPAGTTPITQDLASNSLPPTFRQIFAELGTPADTLDLRWVNGFMYTRLRPLLAPDKSAGRLPPLPVLKLAIRVHPEMRRRNKRAIATLASEPWVKVIHDWHNGQRAGVVAANLALQDVDVAALDDEALIAHARERMQHALTNWRLHFWLHGYDLGPIGRLLYEGADWGITTADLLALLEGASPSTTAPRRAMVAIRSLIEATGKEPTTLHEAREVSDTAREAIDEYLRHHGAHLFSRYDLDGVTLGERPDLVLAAIMNAEPVVHSDVSALAAVVRMRVPAEHRARFETLLAQARDAMDLRDDNGPITAEWTLGLVRLVLLEVGRRMRARGLAHRAEHVFELNPDEVVPGLLSDGTLDAEDLARRAASRQHAKTLDAPKLIGAPEVAPPLSVLPVGLRSIVGMVQTVMSEMAMDGSSFADGLSGAGVGTRSVRGRACVASTPEEAFDLLEPGDILVVASTTPAYNLVLSLVAGVVTAAGGPMSHAAVLARELGIPAIVGASAALIDIPHGAEIELDPVAGTVRVLARL